MMEKLFANLTRAVIFSMLFLGCHTSVAPTKPPRNHEAESQPAAEPTRNDKLLDLHNAQRELKGRVGLSMDDSLNDYAERHAKWMAEKSRLKHSDIGVLMGRWHTAGENIAWNQRDEREVVSAWMNSSGHRANILNRSFSKVGFGLAFAKDGSPYWCTVFAD